MDKLTSISLSEFSKFKVDTKTEQVIIPEGYEVYKRETPLERAQKEILRLQEELKGLIKPDDKELIELGRQYHPYYELQMQLSGWQEFLKMQVKEVEEIKIK